MRITRLGLFGWKGVNSMDAVDRLNLIVGPNASGKTARREALRYAILGTTSLGGTADAAADLAGPSGGNVVIELDDGKRFSRAVNRDPRTGAITRTAMVVHSNMKPTEAAEWISSHCGKFVPMFDLDAFLSLSPNERRNSILEWCGAAQHIDDSGREELIGRLSGGAIQAINDDVEIPASAKGPMRKAVADACIEIVQSLHTTDLTTAIQHCIAESERIRNDGIRDHRSNKAAAIKLGYERAALSAPAESAATLKTRRAVLSSERDQLRDDIARYEGWEGAIRALQRQIADAEAEDERAGTAKRHAAEKALRARDVEAEIARKREQLGSIVLPILTSDADLHAAKLAEQKAKQERFVAVQAAGVAEDQIHKAERDHGIAKDAVERAKADPWQKALDMLAGLCDSEPVTQILLYRVANLRDFMRSQCGAKRDDLALRVSETASEIECARERHAAAKAAADRFESAYQAASAVREQLEQGRHAEQMAYFHAQNTQRGLKDEIASLQREAASIEESVRLADSRAADAQRALLDLRRILDAKLAEAGNVDVGAARANLESVESAIAANKTQADAVARIAAVDTEFAKLQIAAEKAMMMHEAAKRLVASANELRDAMMGELVAPLIGRVNAFIASSGIRNVTAFCDLVDERGKPAIELGWNDGTRRVKLKAFSGAETAIFCAALTAAIVAAVNPPLRLCIVEANAIDELGMRMLMRAFEQFQELDNVFVITSRVHDCPRPEAWNVIETRVK